MKRIAQAGTASRRRSRASQRADAKGVGVSNTLRAEVSRLYDLLELSTLLSSTRNVDQLLKLLAVRTSELLGAERTSIFIYDETREELWSKVAEGEKHKVIRAPVSRGIIGHVFRSRKPLNVKDAYRHPDFNADVDRDTGFVTRNILACPILSRAGGATGVMEVLNKKSGTFIAQDEKMLMSISSLSGVALENSFLIESQVTLFESFIESSIHALGERDRITYGHTIRVAQYSDRIARAISACKRPPFGHIHYSEDALKKLRFAALLHDIGKITVPEAILNKRDKLNPHEIDGIRQRFEQFKLAEKIRAYENGGLDKKAYQSFCRSLDQDYELIARKLTPGPITAEEQKEFDRMRHTIRSNGSRDMQEITETEYQHLILNRGNLTEDEFRVMKDHVKKTWDILGKIYWPKELKEIPFWAATHHERPNGTGYPMGLKGDEIPLEGQILAVADIYDAITAADRPYKKRIPIEVARKILIQAAEIGQVNKDIAELFLAECIDEALK